MALTATPQNAQITHREPIRAARQIYGASTLAISGATELNGNVDMNGTLTVDGASTLTGAVGIAGALAATGRITTTDGVASGTAKVVGGVASNAILNTDDLLASAGASAHVDHAQTYSIPASTLKAGSLVKIKYMVQANQVDGTDTLETKLYLGGTTLMTTTAFDPSAVTDYVIGEFTLVARAAPGAAAAVTGFGRWTTSDNGSLIHGTAILAPTNHATNGALVIKVSSKWSSTTALTNANLAILSVEID